MSAQIQITCCPSDWDKSILTVAGIAVDDGRILLPRNITARDLPDDLLDVWHGAVGAISSLSPGEWAASLVIVKRDVRYSFPNPAIDGNSIFDGPDQITKRDILTCSISRNYSDKTTGAAMAIEFDHPAMLLFFDTLTSPEFWMEREESD